MKHVEKEAVMHGTAQLNLALYEHGPAGSGAYPAAIEAHWHPEYELNYIYRGPVTFFISGRSCTLQTGELLFVEKNRIHSCFDAVCDEIHYVSIVFGEDFVFSSQKDFLYQKYLFPLFQKHFAFPAVVTADTPGGPDILSCVQRFLALYSEKKFAYELSLRSELLRLFQLALEHDLYCESPDSEPPQNSLIHQALLTIRETYMQPLSIHELAASDHVTHSYFCRLFKASVGKSPKEYLLDYRISAACSLLVQTEDPISSVAYACGFDDGNYFARCFKKKMGLSPTSYRKKSHLLKM